MTTIHGKVAALTGASSGLGRALAVALARRGAALALADIDERGLRETVDLLGAGARVTTHLLDVSDLVAMRRFAVEVQREHGGVDIVINNAGITVRASIESVSYEELAHVLGVNLWGVIHGTKEFLPMLQRRREAHIVNIGSVNAFVPFPENGPYNASKYAVLGWSETLMQEFRGTGLHVTCVHPGAVNTNIVRNSPGFTSEDVIFFERVAKTSPAQAARVIIRAIERNREVVTIGSDARFLAWAKRIAPRWIVRIAGEKNYTPPSLQAADEPVSALPAGKRRAEL